ncbi:MULTISPECIES: hypothetical protein [Streptomyces]|uniref:SH3 domain-containing protein n=1 Tax=Streptomyces qinglanensis TaxID=943816 RepID=A0A1E7K6U4_9ACTN|nr:MULTISPECIES: hypothetical protein [Streptomyces]OEU99640.1 hypothetical protein AN217_19530 [Streptomyces qinglanensis]OEV25279.1 hypothetical protein AN220_14750 [Streptomyces nanshensis]
MRRSGSPAGASRRAAAAVGALGLALAGTVVGATPGSAASPPSADAVDCSWAHSNKDAGAGGTTTSTRMQAGPYGACGTVVVAGPGVKMYYHCYVVNKYGNKWSHVRAAGTSINGWVWNEHLDDGGSTKRC